CIRAQPYDPSNTATTATHHSWHIRDQRMGQTQTTDAGASQSTAQAENDAGLSENIKQEIRDALAAFAETPGFRPRKSQRRMIAEVAKTLAGEYGGEQVVCIEGPTGTGK